MLKQQRLTNTVSLFLFLSQASKHLRFELHQDLRRHML